MKNASWLKKRFNVFGFCGVCLADKNSKSIDSMIPARVMISAASLIVFGMVCIVVVCKVESLVIVPTKIDPRVSRRMGLVGGFVS